MRNASLQLDELVQKINPAELAAASGAVLGIASVNGGEVDGGGWIGNVTAQSSGDGIGASLAFRRISQGLGSSQ